MAKSADREPALDLLLEPDPAPQSTDWLALSNLALPQNYEDRLGVKKHLVHVPARKPGGHEYFRVRLGEDWQQRVCMLEDKAEREIYIVAPPMWEALGQDATIRTLLTCITRQGVLFLWPLPDLQTDGRVSAWTATAHEAANMATQAWTRMVANMSLGAYDLHTATGNLAEPSWPEHDFQQLIRIAFKDRLITDADHLAVQRLRGEV